MSLARLKYLLPILVLAGMFSCKNKPAKKTEHLVIFKGLYSYPYLVLNAAAEFVAYLRA